MAGAATALIKSLDFTVSVGNSHPGDIVFNDIVDIGGFPFKQEIVAITKIDVYADKNEMDAGVITGIKVQYLLKGDKTKTVSHGIVNVDNIGSYTINKNQILVGVYGQLKNYPSVPEVDGRLASITFVVFDQAKAVVIKEGPAVASNEGSLGKVWAHFGHIVAFQGTRADEYGLTSLGFVETTAGS